MEDQGDTHKRCIDGEFLYLLETKSRSASKKVKGVYCELLDFKKSNHQKTKGWFLFLLTFPKQCGTSN